MTHFHEIHQLYADYIEELYGGDHEWLVGLLRNRKYRYAESGPRPLFEISILNIVNGHATSQSWRPKRHDHLSEDFSLSLETVPSECKTQILMVQYGNLSQINTAFISAIGLKFNIDPSFWEAHYTLCLERDGTPSSTIPVLLPSEKSFLQIVYNKYSHITTLFVNTIECRLIIILGYDQWPDKFCRLAALREHIHTGMTVEDRRSAEGSPCEFLYSYAHSSLRQIAADCSSSTWSSDIDEQQGSPAETSLVIMKGNKSNRRALLASMDNINRFLSRSGIDKHRHSSKLGELLEDYKAIIKQTETIDADIKSHLQSIQSLEAIKETKRGMKQADSVRRLTFVAFIFIPLSFSCSFFGMNIKQLGTGTANLGYFFLLAFVTGLLAYILSACLKPSEKALSKARHKYAAREFYDDSVSLVDGISWSTLIWDWSKRRMQFLKAVDRAWQKAKWEVAESKGVDFDEVGRLHVSCRFCFRGLGVISFNCFKSRKGDIQKNSTSDASISG